MINKHWGYLFGVFLFLVFPQAKGESTVQSQTVHLNCEIDLAHWGIEDVSEVGYILVGVYHKETGDELVVYDVRKEKPAIEQPSKPQSRVPPLQGDIFLLDDFHGENTNRLGGYFSSIIRSPSESDVTIDESPDGRRCLCFTYNRKPPGVAGFWIHLFDFKLPPVERVFMDASPFHYLTFDIRGDQGGEHLSLQLADYFWEKREDSLRIGNVGPFLPAGRIQRRWQRAWVPLDKIPERIKKEGLASLVFLARQGSGKVYIGDVAFTEKKEAVIFEQTEKKGFSPSPHRGMWLWNTKDLLGHVEKQTRLVDFCARNGITELFMQLPYDLEEKEGKKEMSWDRNGVASMVSLLGKKGVKAHALDGDPRFALREWHGHVLATIRSVIQYNASVKPDERFHGVRYDIEPYILPEFSGVEKNAIIGQYVKLLHLSKELTGSAGLEFGADIPFWFDQKNEFFEPIAEIENRPLTEAILDIVDNIGIMDYRTAAYGADGVIAHALGELQYASKKGKKVFIGLETAELPDETLLEFGRDGGASRIFFEEREGSKILLEWIPDETGSEIPGALFLSQKKITTIPSRKLTFADRGIEELMDVMEKAESEFMEYPSFYGFAVHSYESYQNLFKKTR